MEKKHICLWGGLTFPHLLLEHHYILFVPFQGAFENGEECREDDERLLFGWVVVKVRKITW